MNEFEYSVMLMIAQQDLIHQKLEAMLEKTEEITETLSGVVEMLENKTDGCS